MAKSLQSKLDQLHQKVHALIGSNCSEDEIIDALRNDGIDEHYARTLIENVLNDQEDKANFRRLLFIGIAAVVAGIIINVTSYKLALRTPGYGFIVFWGVVLYGIILIIRALMLYRK
ncbi:MAG: hypothetical protein JST86_20990 [Bacteroidetes bacterium]|nr:hypothetical protein [Bacteroidota bacterium]